MPVEKTTSLIQSSSSPRPAMSLTQSAAWKSSVAGIAANTASQILYPLESIKLRFQANN